MTRRNKNGSLQPMQVTADYQKMLKRVFDLRRTRNPAYSLRSFARDLKLSPASLSKVLSHQQGLSTLKAKQIASDLQLETREQSRFVDSVVATHSRSETDRKKAEIRLLQYQQETKPEIEEGAFRVISDWYHLAIVELTRVEGFQPHATWIADTLGISEAEAQRAVERLLSLELLKWEGDRLIDAQGFAATASDKQSEAIRNFHHQVLRKAIESIEGQSMENRDLSAIVLAFPKSEIPSVKKWIKTFRRNVDARITSSKKKPDSVYALAIQFFELSSSKEKR